MIDLISFSRARSSHHGPASQPQVKPTAALASQFAFPKNASKEQGYVFTGPNAAASSRPAGPARPHRPHPPSPLKPTEVSRPLPFARPLSRDELRIYDHHTQTNTVPLPFSKVQPNDVARIRAAVAAHKRTGSQQSGKPSLEYPDPAMHRKPFSIVSSQRNWTKHVSASGSVASSFSFASMPYRGSTLGALQEDTSAATAAPTIQPGMHVVKVAFTPLLPDEVALEVGERATVVDVYDDGWCVVLSSGAEVVMGAVPLWCFAEPDPEKPEGFEHSRPERTTSLGVKVELEEEPDTSGHSSRHDSVFSWSNF